MTRPSWGYMVSKGTSGMWEHWDQDRQGAGMNGQGFQMLTGDLNAWIYQALAGIRPDPQRPGFKHIILRPQSSGNLTYVNASYKSMHGRIVSNWQIDQKGTFTWHVTIPANTAAAVYVPKSGMQNLVVKESSKVIWKDGAFVRRVAGISDDRENKKGIIFTMASECYIFEREWKD